MSRIDALRRSSPPPGCPGVPGHEPDEEKARRDAAAVTPAMSRAAQAYAATRVYVWEADYCEPNRQDSFWEKIMRLAPSVFTSMLVDWRGSMAVCLSRLV
jgi:hypothetical protein